MNSETKAIGLIGIITIIVIAGGLWLAAKNGSGTGGVGGGSDVTIKAEALAREDSPRITGKNAKVQIVEFSDLECPACAMLHPEIEKLLETDGDSIDLVFRFIPIHKNSKPAVAAAMAAGEQDKFFEMYSIIFEHQSDWTAFNADVNKFFDSYAEEIGLDVNKYRADLSANQARYYALVDRDAADATAMNVSSTPTLIFDGKLAIRGAIPYDKLKKIFDDALNGTLGMATALTASSSSPASAK